MTMTVPRTMTGARAVTVPRAMAVPGGGGVARARVVPGDGGPRRAWLGSGASGGDVPDDSDGAGSGSRRGRRLPVSGLDRHRGCRGRRIGYGWRYLVRPGRRHGGRLWGKCQPGDGEYQ